MAHPSPDVVDLLYPEASARQAEDARRWVTHLRLLDADCGTVHASTVGIGPVRALQELEQVLEDRLHGALEAILSHCLGALLTEDSCAGYGRPVLGHQEAWTVLEQFRSQGQVVPEVPCPGDDPLTTAARLLESADSLGLPPDRLALWRIRRARLRGVPLPSLPANLPAPTARELAADAAAEHLDRGRVRAASQQLAECESSAGPLVGRAALLREWCWAVLDAGGSAMTKVSSPGDDTIPSAGSEPWSGSLQSEQGLPTPLMELREAWPETLPHLRGGVVEGRVPVPSVLPLPSRSALGASVLVELSFDGSATRCVDVQVPPALTRSVAGWHRGRDRAWRDLRAPEHELLLSGRPVLRRSRAGEGAPQGALDPASRSLALIPLPAADEGREWRGWIQLEFRHGWLPARARLASWGRGAVREVGIQSESPRQTARPFGRSGASEVELSPPHVDAGKTFEELLCSVGTKTAHRRWWGFVVDEEQCLAVASGGNGLVEAPPGGGRALARALRTGGVASFQNPDSALAQARTAASGVVIPARLGGQVVALLAMESDRKRAFRTRDVKRLDTALQEQALALRLAAFRAWHLAHHGRDLAFAPGDPGFISLAARIRSAARARTSVLLDGPPGAGKRVLLRWLQFERTAEEGRADGPVVPIGADNPPAPSDLPALLDGRALMLEGVDRWPAPTQCRLARVLTESPDASVTVHLDGTLESAREEERIDSSLARVLETFVLSVAPLADRRGELPALVASMLGDLRRRHGGPVLALEDEALALLWRQPWVGGFAALEAALLKLTLDAESELLGADQVSAILGRYGPPLLKRLPSRRPRPLDLEAALHVTRLDSGRVNKTRAALYLGWDPDTLVARMEDLGIE